MNLTQKEIDILEDLIVSKYNIYWETFVRLVKDKNETVENKDFYQTRLGELNDILRKIQKLNED